MACCYQCFVFAMRVVIDALLLFVVTRSLLLPRELLPGEAAPVWVHIIPTRTGLVSFNDLYIVDVDTR
jgi:hypothetical protein